MAQQDNRVGYSDLSLKFGLERTIDFCFAARDRNWSCLKNATIDTNRTSQQDENEGAISPEEKKELLDQKKQSELEIKHLRDVGARLETQRAALRLIVAESLRDYHQQFKMILGNPEMAVKAIGPELLELNRENLKLQLDISKIKPPTQEEEKAMDSRISERLNARLGNLSSERKLDPSPPKTVNIRAPTGEKRLEQSEDGGRSTAISTQRPERLRPNAVLSPATQTASNSQRHEAGGMQSAGRGGKSVSRSPSNDRNAQSAAAPGSSSAPSAEDPMSAKAKLIQAKKNATITEEDDETESKDEI